MAIALSTSVSACATAGFYTVPSVSVATVYDDNLFFSREDKTSALFARLTPDLKLGYETKQLMCRAGYTFDAEAYAGNTELNAAMARQFADVAVEYRPNSRLTLGAVADYAQTDTPVDLSLVAGSDIPGLLEGRTNAERLSFHPQANYRFTSTLNGSLAYTQSKDTLSGTGNTRTRAVDGYFDQRISAVNTLSYGYLQRQYRFAGDAGSARPGDALTNSSTPWLGLAHRFNRRTSIDLRAGPRFENGSVKPYLHLSILYLYKNGEVQLSYERDETTLVAAPGKQEIESLFASWTHHIGSKLDLYLTPGYAKADQTEDSVDIYSLVAGAIYRINRSVFLTASYDLNTQRVHSSPGAPENVSRNVIQFGITMTYPRRRVR